MRRHVAQAVASPIEAVRAIHIRAAEHQAALARASGLDDAPARPARDTERRAISRVLAWIWRGWNRMFRRRDRPRAPEHRDTGITPVRGRHASQGSGGIR
jgi:hypothetical protein